MNDRSRLLITAEDLDTVLRNERGRPPGEPRTLLLDVRWTLSQPDGRPLHERGHIPGAVYVDLETELAGHATAHDGRHPLPSRSAFQAAARRWGLRAQDRVIVYDGGGNYAAARLWWLLRYFGFDEVRLLDGALPAWETAGLPLETGDTAARPGDIVLTPGRLPVLELEDLPGFIERGGTLVDARARERYRGDTEPVDPRAGHIPGAISTPTGENLDARGHFLSGEQLRERFAEAGVREGAPVGSYCGSGVTAAHNLVALELAGIGGALYPGSWSQWSNRSELPVAIGDE